MATDRPIRDAGSAPIPEAFVIATTRDGLELRATPLHLSPYGVDFEVYNPYGGVRLSEVLDPMRIVVNEQTVYRGRATVSAVTGGGLMSLVEVTLDRPWSEPDTFHESTPGADLWIRFSDWRKSAAVAGEFRQGVDALRRLLEDLRNWMHSHDLQAGGSGTPESWPDGGSHPGGAFLGKFSAELERILARLATTVRGLPARSRAAHRAYAHRELHPFLLESPFLRRAFTKPCGYVPDSSLALTMSGNEAPSLDTSAFGRVIEAAFLRLMPTVGRRHEVGLIREQIEQESLRARAAGRPLRVLGLGGASSVDLHGVLAETPLPPESEVILVNAFDPPPDEGAGDRPLPGAAGTVRGGIASLLKGFGTGASGLGAEPFDCIVCTGVTDYLPDRLCRRVADCLFSHLGTGGSFLMTNSSSLGGFGVVMDMLLDWHLNLRTDRQLRDWLPPTRRRLDWVVQGDPASEIVFLRVRKTAS